MQVSHPATPQQPAPAQSPPSWTQTEVGKRFVYIKDSRVNPSFLGHALLSIGMILLAIGTYRQIEANIYRKASEWQVCNQVQNDTQDKKSDLETDHGSLNLEDLKKQIKSPAKQIEDPVLLRQQERLIAQVNQLDRAQRSACSIGIYFFANRVATSTIATASGIAAVASLAFVSKRGWDQSNNAIINVGVTSGLILFSAWTFSQLYSQGNNFESQRKRQSLAINLLNTIASASANRSADIGSDESKTESNKKTIDINTAKGMQTFIQFIDTQLESINELNFGLDDSFAKSAVGRITPFFPTEVPEKTLNNSLGTPATTSTQLPSQKGK